MFKRSDQDSRQVRRTSSWTGPPSRRARAIRFPQPCSPPAVDVRRATAVSGAPRLPYCMMGVCFDCLVTIDGVGNRQGCLVPVPRACRSKSRRASGRSADEHELPGATAMMSW